MVKPGIERVLAQPERYLGGRVGLVCHAASLTRSGISSAVALRRALGSRLTAMFGPEHGVSGRGGAGEVIGHTVHPRWRIPIYSLYGATRRPTSEMLRRVDTLVFDLQDIGARPYTYVSTLREILEAAAKQSCRVVVADRPAPLANTVDGPMLNPRFHSFVGHIPAPVVYGMTPGETAIWLRNVLRLKLDLVVAPCEGYRRQARPHYRWRAPSPAIVSWNSGLCFPITVFFEAIPALDHSRGTDAPFERVAAPYLDVLDLSRRLTRRQLPGIRFTPCSYHAATGLYRGRPVQGVRMTITAPLLFRPVQTAVVMIHELQNMLGQTALWRCPGARPDFFDKLMGTDRVRKLLEKGIAPDVLFAQWRRECAAFLREREKALLYAP